MYLLCWDIDSFGFNPPGFQVKPTSVIMIELTLILNTHTITHYFSITKRIDILNNFKEIYKSISLSIPFHNETIVYPLNLKNLSRLKKPMD